jgi:Tfp pilus assembly PilM family ATPase
MASEPVPGQHCGRRVIDGAAVADAIRRLFENKAFKTKEGRIPFRQRRHRQKISLPVMTEAELSESIYWEAGNTFPLISGRQHRLSDSRSGTGPDSGTMDVPLVAAKKGRSPTTPASSPRPGACR